MNKKTMVLLTLPILAIFGVMLVYPVVYAVANSDENIETDDTPFITQLAFSGKVDAYVHDINGFLKSEHHSSNIMVNVGENCVAKLLFARTGGDATGNDVCEGTIDSGFRYIGLEESATAVASDDSDLNDPADSAGLSTPIWASVVWTNSTGTGGTSKAIIVLTSQFTNSGASETIQGAGLFNATSQATRGMYAHTLFSSAAVVDTTDVLTVTWTITTGAGTVS